MHFETSILLSPVNLTLMSCAEEGCEYRFKHLMFGSAFFIVFMKFVFCFHKYGQPMKASDNLPDSDAIAQEMWTRKLRKENSE
jgi:hypothetical protein